MNSLQNSPRSTTPIRFKEYPHGSNPMTMFTSQSGRQRIIDKEANGNTVFKHEKHLGVTQEVRSKLKNENVVNCVTVTDVIIVSVFVFT